MRAWCLALGLAACADIPKARFDDGGISTRLDEVTGAVIVNGSGFELQFGLPDQMDSFPMPDRFTIGPDNDKRDVLLDAIPDCAFETRIGLALFPGLDITSVPGHLGPGGQTHVGKIHQTANMNGPGAIQFDVVYDAEYAVGTNPTRRFAGTTTFTFFATGRVVRHDTFAPFAMTDPTLTNAAANDPFGCDIGNNLPNGFALSTYWAFENTTGGTQVQANGDQVTEGTPQACTFFPSRKTMIGVSFPPPRVADGVRYSPGGNSAAHVYDFIHLGDTSVPFDMYDVSSAIKVASDITDPTQCADVLGELDDGKLRINGMAFGSDANGIYHGLDDQPLDGTIEIKADAGRLPQGVAVILNLGNASHADVRKLGGGSDPPAYTQRLDDQRVLFVFRDSLLATDTIQIEPF